jgi:pyruvate dehydrogenase E1 component
VPYAVQCLGKTDGVIVAAADYVKALPDLIARWLPSRCTSLGTDGFGRSESRSALRDFFEVDAKAIVVATLSALARTGEVPPSVAQDAMKDFGIDPERDNPAAL